ncbi:MAG TPA: TetR/AcrR family transcriptional regulator [Pseudonocardiaceae bacterium]|jgi:AcrR family transcriptional regulator
MTTDDATSDLNAVIDLLWSPAPTPRRGPKPGLTLTDIATAGITIADTDNLGAVTMQRVADALGVTKMALYRYVRSKTELVALMTDVAIGEPATPDAHTDWRTALHTWAHAMIDRFVQHPWTQETTTGTRAIGPNEIGWLEQALTALDGTSLTGSEKLDVAATLAGHARAIAQQATASLDSPEKGLETIFAMVLRDHAAHFPALTAALDSATDDGRDQAFDFGLNRILDGVELLVKQRS